MNFGEAVSLVSVIFGSGSVVGAVARWVAARFAEWRKLKEAAENRFRRVLASDDLLEIGSYLDDVIGQFEIAEYVHSPRVSQRVDAYLEKLNEFLQMDAEVDAENRQSESPPPEVVEAPAGEELERIEQELREGEVWNALARLRRHMEIRLREVAARLDVVTNQRASASTLVESLNRAGVIDKVTSHRLRYAIGVCNTAVHGGEVPLDAAETAVHQAATALGALPNVTEVPADAYAGTAASVVDRVRPAVAVEEVALPEGERPPDRDTLWAKAQGLIIRREAEQGAALLKQVVQLDLAANSPDVSDLNQLSGLLDRIGRYEDAVSYAEMAINKFPADVGARFNRAVIEIHRGGTAKEDREKRRHWRDALASFDEARRRHETGTVMDDVNYGKMWLFAGETAQYIAELGPTTEARSDWRQKAAAWYNEGYVWLLHAQPRATQDSAALVSFWLSDAHERTFRIHRLDRQADGAGLRRTDIARLDNKIPFWRKEDEAEYRKLAGPDDESGES